MPLQLLIDTQRKHSSDIQIPLAQIMKKVGSQVMNFFYDPQIF